MGFELPAFEAGFPAEVKGRVAQIRRNVLARGITPDVGFGSDQSRGTLFRIRWEELLYVGPGISVGFCNKVAARIFIPNAVETFDNPAAHLRISAVAYGPVVHQHFAKCGECHATRVGSLARRDRDSTGNDHPHTGRMGPRNDACPWSRRAYCALPRSAPSKLLRHHGHHLGGIHREEVGFGRKLIDRRQLPPIVDPNFYRPAESLALIVFPVEAYPHDDVMDYGSDRTRVHVVRSESTRPLRRRPHPPEPGWFLEEVPLALSSVQFVRGEANAQEPQRLRVRSQNVANTANTLRSIRPSRTRNQVEAFPAVPAGHWGMAPTRHLPRRGDLRRTSRHASSAGCARLATSNTKSVAWSMSAGSSPPRLVTMRYLPRKLGRDLGLVLQNPNSDIGSESVFVEPCFHFLPTPHADSEGFASSRLLAGRAPGARSICNWNRQPAKMK